MNITFSDNHSKTNEKENCQLFVAMTGTKEFVKSQLQRLLAECEDEYSKPRQGIISSFNGTVDIQTPVWDGKDYQ